MTNIDGLENLTFLVCLKNRIHVTKRLVNYLNKINYNLNLFFSDGGDIDQSQILGKLSSNHKYIYKKFPYDYDFLCYAKKICQSLKLINTKYVIIMDSDDFLNFDAMVKHLNFLENNTDFITSTGKIINFNLIDNKKIEIIDQQYYQKKTVNFKKTSKFVDFSSWQGVHFTNRLLKNFEKIVHFKINDIRFICDTINISSQVDGKLNFNEDEILILRQANTAFYDVENDVSASTLMKKNVKFVSIWKLKSLIKSLNVFKIISSSSDTKHNLFFLYYLYYFKNLLKFNVINDLKKILNIKINKQGQNINLSLSEIDKNFINKCINNVYFK